MIGVTLDDASDVEEWRAKARALLLAEVDPADVAWMAGPDTSLFGGNDGSGSAITPPGHAQGAAGSSAGPRRSPRLPQPGQHRALAFGSAPACRAVPHALAARPWRTQPARY